jgi:hypothetical protein
MYEQNKMGQLYNLNESMKLKRFFMKHEHEDVK